MEATEGHNGAEGSAEPVPAPGRIRSAGRWAVVGLAILLSGWASVRFLMTVAFSVGAWGFVGALSDGVLVARFAQVTVAVAILLLILGPARGRRPGLVAAGVAAASALLGYFLTASPPISWRPFLWPVVVAAILVIALWPGGLRPLIAEDLRPQGRPLTGGLLAGFIAMTVFGADLAGFIGYGYVVRPYPTAAPAPVADRELSRSQTVRYLLEEYGRLQIDLFETIPEPEFRRLTENMVAEAPKWSPEETAIRLGEVTARRRDSHSHPFYDGPQHYMSFELRWAPDGFYVVALPPEHEALLGQRLISIGGKPIDDIVESATQLIGAENRYWLQSELAWQLNQSAFLDELGLADGDEVTITVSAGGAETSAVVAEGGPMISIPFRPSPTDDGHSDDEVVWFEYLDDETLYLRYRSCTDPLQIRQVFGEFWDQVDDRQPAKIIVDVRGNGGGNSLFFSRWFTGALKDRPEYRDPSRLIGLIDVATFSSAVDASWELSRELDGTLIGTPTGGAPGGYGEVREIRQPIEASDGGGSVGLRYTTRRPEPRWEGLATLDPDLEVPYTGIDVLENNDAVLDAALEY